MKKLGSFLNGLWHNEQAQGMVEYGLILALIAVVVIGVLTLMGTSIKAKYDSINNALQPAAQ